MRRRLLILTCLLCGLTAAAAKKPNVVLIITDDQSWDSLGFMGGNVHTPRLDQMARDGLHLRDFNVTSTVCSPSRYSFLTGRYAGRCEGERFMQEHPPGDQTQVENIGELEPDRWNLAKVLQKNGYKTGFVGKSHLVNHEWINGDWTRAGLETYSKAADPRDPEVNDKMRRNHAKWCEAVKPYGFDYVDGIVGNIDFAPTILDLCGIRRPADYRVDGVSFRAVLFGGRQPVRESLFGEMGHSRGVKTKDWKYIAIRYPEDVQRKIANGAKFPAFEGHPPLDRPYLTRNQHLGHYASKVNPHYFEPDQLYNLKTDPEENDNVFPRHPEVAQRMKRKLAKALRPFEGRPFGEFTKRSTMQDNPRVASADTSTLNGKVMCGYQGWYRSPGDGSGLAWVHYRGERSMHFRPGECGIEYWPDMTEMDADEKCRTPFKHEDGSGACVYSSMNRKTTLRHFSWMKEYGIDGVAVQRFLMEVQNDDDRDAVLSGKSFNRVLELCREGANKYGRTYHVMYDLTSIRPGYIERAVKDWKFLVDEMGITRDPNDLAYQHHGGGPVVGIWGMGFRHVRVSPAECERFIDFLKNDPKYGGNTVLGTPNMDRIGQEGVYFELSNSQCPVCGPARSSLMTGRTVEHTAVRTRRSPRRNRLLRCTIRRT